jgi:hypothetical protein
MVDAAELSNSAANRTTRVIFFTANLLRCKLHNAIVVKNDVYYSNRFYNLGFRNKLC